MTRWSLFLQTLSLLHHFLGLYSAGSSAHLSLLSPRALSCPQSGSDSTYPPVQISGATSLCGSCGCAGWREDTQQGTLATGVARDCGDVGSVAGWPSGRERNGLQPGQGATELGFPRPAPGEMQSEAARRAGDPSHQSEDPPPEGLGDHGPLAQTNPRRPAVQVMRHHLDRQPGTVGGEARRRHVVQPDAVLEVAYDAGGVCAGWGRLH